MATQKMGLGILLMLGAYLLFTFSDSTTKWLVVTGIPILQIAFVRYAVHFLITAGEAFYRGYQRSQLTEHFWLLFLRGWLIASATIANFHALKYLSLSMVAAVMFSAPIFVSLMSWPILGERVGPWRWAAIALGFIGVMVIVRPFANNFHPASLLLLYAAIALASYSIITRKLAHQVKPHVMQLFTGAFGTVVLLPFVIWVWTPISPLTFAMVTWVGFFSWAGHELLTRAHQFAAASVLMPYSYSFIIYMTLAGFLIYGELPDGFTVLGAAIIVLAGLVIWKREQYLKDKSSRPLAKPAVPPA